MVKTALKNRGQALLKRSGGQALLIILLAMAVALTIALSIASRSISDITISQKGEESSRAFSAAEAGIEQALIAQSGASGELPAGGQFTATITSLAEGGTNLVVPLFLASGETIPIWFVSHGDDGSLTCGGDSICFTGDQITFCWGETGTSSSSQYTPALEASILYTERPGDYTTTKIARGAYDPYGSRRGTNSFAAADVGCSISDRSFAFGKTIQLADLGISRGVSSQPNNLQQARVRLLYNTDRSHPLGISVATPLPRQGTKIESVGTAGGASQTTRKIELYQLFSDLPPVFDFGIFSGSGGLTK